jgi:hypothetical protein
LPSGDCVGRSPDERQFVDELATPIVEFGDRLVVQVDVGRLRREEELVHSSRTRLDERPSLSQGRKRSRRVALETDANGTAGRHEGIGVARQRGGCGCLLLLVFVGAIFGGQQFDSAKQRAREVIDALPTVSAHPAGKQTARTSSPSRPKRTAAPRTSAYAPVPSPGVPDVVEEVYYRSCAAVRAAGKAPIRRGSPGYRTALDRDRDGIACDVG